MDQDEYELQVDEDSTLSKVFLKAQMNKSP